MTIQFDSVTLQAEVDISLMRDIDWNDAGNLLWNEMQGFLYITQNYKMLSLFVKEIHAHINKSHQKDTIKSGQKNHQKGHRIHT